MTMSSADVSQKPIIITNEEKKTVEQLLMELGLLSSKKYLAVLVNGQVADLKQHIDPGQQIVVLPTISGG